MMIDSQAIQWYMANNLDINVQYISLLGQMHLQLHAIHCGSIRWSCNKLPLLVY